jgi:hypothetical protein
MKANFKPLGLAVAVAAVSAGYAGVANSAAAVSDNGLGDLAIIPYYTVKSGFTTGFLVTNTSERTQVVKVRLRRARDSMDALDINVVMSPKDVWAANIREEEGTIYLVTDDNSCTVPAGNAGEGRFVMSTLYNASGDAEEGYIEIIGMGSPDYQYSIDSDSPFEDASGEKTEVAKAAEHDDDGVPEDCSVVRQNFFSQNVQALAAEGVGITDYGNLDHDLTGMLLEDEDGDEWKVNTEWGDTDDVLRVSYLIRDTVAGLEFGNEAVHIAGFLDQAAMTNQQYGLFAGDASGFDYPDLNGGAPRYDTTSDEAGEGDGEYGIRPPTGAAGQGFTSRRGKFNDLRDVLGVQAVLNDWSTNPANGVATDWVVTFPGQYTMFDYLMNNQQLFGLYECGEESPLDEDIDLPECDFRDLPVRASFAGDSSSGTWDREEQEGPRGEGGLVVSPQIPGQSQSTLFKYEVNVVEWAAGSEADAPVFGSDFAISVDASPIGVYGWAQLSVTQSNRNGQKICDLPIVGGGAYGPGERDQYAQTLCSSDVNSGIPMVGFVAWERSFPETPDRNYGRIVEHAWISPVSSAP